MWKIKLIVSNEGLNNVSHSNYKEFWYNVMVGWGTGKTITESLTIIIGGDTVTCVLYADDGKEKGEQQKSGRFSYFYIFPPYH